MTSQTTAKIELPEKLVRVFEGEARFRGAYGGRGGAKSRAFALMSAVVGYKRGMAGDTGQILCGREFMNSLDDSSLSEVKAAIQSVDWLRDYYEVGEKYIRSKDGRIRYTFAGLRWNIDSIKSKARVLLAWVDEAERVSEEAWRKLIPTVREDDSEIWVTWNPESKRSATHKRFRENPPEASRITQIGWQDNPWFPDVLNRDRLEDKEKRPHMYDHIWEGDFVPEHEGAYFADGLRLARKEDRICNLARDPLLPTFAFWDIGGTGRLSDTTAIWVCQFVGQSIHVLDYYEAQGQELATHVEWLRDRGYEKTMCVLPHDGGTMDKVYRVSYETSLQAAGFDVTVVPNQGAGAARKRIEEVRRLFPSMYFDAEDTEQGREALAWYHEKWDDKRETGLGPEHDWASHGADAFGLMAIFHNLHKSTPNRHKRVRRSGWAA